MPHKWTMAESTTKTWNIWCEAPQISNFPGIQASGKRV